jgi:hypothetical protein
MSYLDEIYNDEVYTGPHSLETYFAEEYITEPMYESTALSEKNNRPVLKNVDFNHFESQQHPVRPPRGFIKYKTISPPNHQVLPEVDTDEDTDEEEPPERFNLDRTRRKKILGRNLSGQRSGRKKGRKDKLGKAREFFGVDNSGSGSECSGLRMIDIFILVLICILMVMQIKINWSLSMMTNPHHRSLHRHHPELSNPVYAQNQPATAPRAPVGF